MLPWSTEIRGRFDEHVVESELLRGNPLGDPHARPLWVYVPPGYEDDADRRYPSIYVLQGLTGQLDMWRNRAAFRPSFPELVDELAAPCVVVFVDAWTSLGGSQFVDSPGTGRYGSYICDEVVTFVDERYRTLPVPEHRGIMGKSSGGYGAMVTPMLFRSIIRRRWTKTQARAARGEAVSRARSRCQTPSHDRDEGATDIAQPSLQAAPTRGRRGHVPVSDHRHERRTASWRKAEAPLGREPLGEVLQGQRVAVLDRAVAAVEELEEDVGDPDLL